MCNRVNYSMKIINYILYNFFNDNIFFFDLYYYISKKIIK